MPSSQFRFQDNSADNHNDERDPYCPGDSLERKDKRKHGGILAFDKKFITLGVCRVGATAATIKRNCPATHDPLKLPATENRRRENRAVRHVGDHRAGAGGSIIIRVLQSLDTAPISLSLPYVTPLMSSPWF